MFASVTVTASGSLIRSRHCSFVIFSMIVVPYSGSGHRQNLCSRSWSIGSPVLSLRSSPLMVIETSGSLLCINSPSAHVPSIGSVVFVLSVTTLSIRP